MNIPLFVFKYLCKSIMDMKEGKLSRLYHQYLLCVHFNLEVMVHLSLGIDYIDLDDSEVKLDEKNNLVEGDDEEFYSDEEEPSLLEEYKLMITHGVLMGCNNITIRVVQKR